MGWPLATFEIETAENVKQYKCQLLICAQMQVFPQNWLHRNILEETNYKDSSFNTLYDILAQHYCKPRVKLKPHVQGQDHFTPLLAREPFNEERLATVQIERGSGKREITWMQAAIKALIFCKNTFAAYKIVQHTCPQNKKQSTLPPMKSLSLPYSLFIQLWKVHERGVQYTIIFSFQHPPTHPLQYPPTNPLKTFPLY